MASLTMPAKFQSSVLSTVLITQEVLSTVQRTQEVISRVFLYAVACPPQSYVPLLLQSLDT
jgi:hypothetical protein